MRIAILDDYQSLANGFADWGRLDGRATLRFYFDPIGDHSALVKTLQEFDVICLMRERTPFPKALIDSLPNLKLIVTSGMKNASIDVAAATARGIVVSGTPSPGHATAELAFGLIIALARNLVPQSNSLREGGWHQGIGRDLRGATLGILGLGRLGSQVAGFAQAFGMNTIAWSQNLSAEQCAECGVEYRSKNEFFAEADFISIHLRLSDRTRSLVDTEEFALMKSDAYLVNTSRAEIIEQQALKHALANNLIGGVAIDVYEQEPMPAYHWLLGTSNSLLTPHIGYVTRETYQIFYGETLAAVEAWMAGEPIRKISA